MRAPLQVRLFRIVIVRIIVDRRLNGKPLLLVPLVFFIQRVLESCNNPYISRAELDDESDLDDFVLRLFVEEEIEEKECTNPAMAESFIEDMAELVTGIAEAHSFLDLEGSFSVTWKGTTSAYAFVSPGGDDGCDFQELGVTE